MTLDMQAAQDDEESNPKVDSETYDVIFKATQENIKVHIQMTKTP